MCRLQVTRSVRVAVALAVAGVADVRRALRCCSGSRRRGGETWLA